MSNEKRVMELDKIEFAIILNSLMEMRSAMLKEKQETDLVDKVIRKTVKAPSKERRGIFHRTKGNDNHAER